MVQFYLAVQGGSETSRGRTRGYAGLDEDQRRVRRFGEHTPLRRIHAGRVCRDGHGGDPVDAEERHSKDQSLHPMLGTRNPSLAPGRRETAETVRLLEVDPDLGSLLNDARRAEAEEALVV